MRPAIACILLHFACLPLAAQKLETAEAPIDVRAQPALALPGTTVTLSGSSLVLKDLDTVTVVVRDPGGQEASLEGKLDDKGSYTVAYTVAVLGTHQVTATAPDGKATATAAFTAMSAAGLTDQSLVTTEKLFGAAGEGVRRITEAANRMPASPAQAELVKRLDELAEGIDERSAQMAKLSDGMQELARIVGWHPSTAEEFAPIYEAFAEVEEEAPPLISELDRRVEQMGSGISRCDRLDFAAEAVNFLGLLLSLPGKPIEVAINLLADKTFSSRLSARDPVLAADPNAKFVVDNAIKHSVAMAQSFDGWRGGLYNSAGDVAVFALQTVLGVYCEKFEGPFNASFHLEYFEQGAKWLAYDVELTGMLLLRYEKGAETPIPITGEFEGVASFPALWEDFLVVEPGARAHTYARMARTPKGVDAFLPEAGKFGRAALAMLSASPGYFYVPIEGFLDGNEFSLKIKPANQDYPDRAKGQVIYVLWSAQVMIPQIKKLDVKYQGAHYILSRGTHEERGTSEEPFPLKVKVDAARKISVIEKTFTRQERDPGFLLDWRIDLKTCNPGCPY